MSDKAPEKFKKKMDITFEQAFRMRFETQVDITNAFVPIVGKEKAFEIVEKLSEKKSIESAKQMVIHSEDINNFADFKAFFKKQMNSNMMKNTATFTIIEDSEKKLEFKITECLWAKVFKDLDETEQGYRFYCKPDYAMAGIYHPKVKLTRTKTLMQGNVYCNHTYTWEE
ncbi:MAG: L-2-amino-thiazoline-4-carboxylic acid hydrolase [Asgard group archaeon]|nr:L-2-amino-thiazoline-4-carboxylic acid hydrolase [Asgard group archaeon]